MTDRCILLICAALAAGTCTADQVLFNAGSTWTYLDNGSDQGNAWRSPLFDDSAWASGSAQLGYGDGDEATTNSYGSVSTNKYITTYFRSSFVITNTTEFPILKFQLLRDDGAVVYMNGYEVRRDNLPDGAVSYISKALSAVDGTEEDTFYETEVSSAGLLVEGTNSIAVEIHQQRPSSSDISLDLVVVGATSTVIVTSGSLWKYLDDGSDQGTAWRTNGFDDSGWSSGTARFGYGNGDEITTNSYGPSSSDKHITTYYRHSVHIDDPSWIQTLRMNLLRDDGAVVYINGSEVRRDNMPAGTITNQTRASTAIDVPVESEYYETFIPAAGLFTNGSNVIAVEIHQANATSSDISFDMELEGFESEPRPSLLRGPYLQFGTPTSVIIRWRTDMPTNTSAWIGTDSPTSHVSSAAVTNDHELIINGLSPASTYMYAVGFGTNVIAGGDTNHMFTTAPQVGSRTSVWLWVLGDSGTANINARNVRDAYYAWSTNRQPDIWLMLGDNAYESGLDSEYQAAVFDTYPTTLSRSVLWPTLGNHDGYSANSAVQTGTYYEAFTLPTNGVAGGLASGTEAYYAFDYANIHFVSLDSYETSRATNGAMLTWMKNDVASTTQEWLIAFWHHPPYSKGSHNSDTDGRMTDMRENVLPMLEEAGVDLVLCGHSHSYERSYLINGHYDTSGTFNASMQVNAGDGREDSDGVYEKTLTNGAVYAVAGSSGKISGGALNHQAMFISLNALGSMVFHIEGGELKAYFIGDTPVVKDYFTIRKSTPVYTLDTVVQGEGGVLPFSGTTYLSNTLVNASAQPSNFYAFTGWGGDLSGSVSPAPLLMDGDKLITAAFDAILVTNGVPQRWLFDYGLGTNDADALDDQDVDHMKTWEEFIADTVPTSSASFFMIHDLIATGGPSATAGVRFKSSSNRIYGVDRTAVSGELDFWEEVTNNVGGTGAEMSIEDSTATNAVNYRVRVSNP